MVSQKQFLLQVSVAAEASAVAPKLMFFGDPHGDFKAVIAAVQRYRPEAVVLLGDVQARQPLHVELQSIRDLTEIWFIHGNHDTDSDADHDNLWRSELADRNLHGRVVEIAGYRVAGLGGIFRGKIWNPTAPRERVLYPPAEHLQRYLDRRRVPRQKWRDVISRRHRSSIFRDDYEAMLSLKADVLVSHEAPVAAPRGRHFGFAAIDELAISLGARLVVHRAIDYVREGLMTATAPFRAFGVDMGSHLVWPLDGRGPR